MRETLQLHASITERNNHIQNIVRTITCQDLTGGRSLDPRPVVENPDIPIPKNDNESKERMLDNFMLTKERLIVDLEEGDEANCRFSKSTNGGMSRTSFVNFYLMWLSSLLLFYLTQGQKLV